MTSSRPMSPCDIRQRARSNDGERKVGLTLVLVAAPSIKGNIVLTQIWPDGRPGGRPPTRRQGVFAGKQTVFGHELLSLPLSLLYPPVFVFVSQLFLVSESVCVLQLVRTFGVIPSNTWVSSGYESPRVEKPLKYFALVSRDKVNGNCWTDQALRKKRRLSFGMWLSMATIFDL